MEEEKAAALYDELTRKGGGAARFKQGLGFSSSSGDAPAAVPARGSALPIATSSSSFLSQFVKASESSSAAPQVDKQAQLGSVQNKLKKKLQKPQNPSSESDIRRSSRRSRSRSPSKDRHQNSRRRIRSRSQSRDLYWSSRHRSRHSRRSRSRSRGRDEHYRGGRRRRSRSESPRQRRNGDDDNRRRSNEDKGKSGKVDFAKLIEGYDKMTAAERVKAKMKLQLSETAEKDEKKGMGSGWERFDFNKDAPLDDEEEIETAEDDAALVKHIGQTFRFSAVEAKRGQALKDAHDEAMFGAPSVSSPTGTGEEEEEEEAINFEKQSHETAPASLLSDQVLGMQKVSWRDRVHRSS